MQHRGAKRRPRELGRQERQRHKEAERADRRSKSGTTEASGSGDPDEDPDLIGIVAGPQPPVVD